jgi:transcriptional regulator with XRE-family HTH domain
MSRLSNNIRFLRRQKELTQSEFAEKIGVKRSVIGAYEEGRAEPKLQTLQLMCDFFQISLDSLVNKDVEQEKPVQKNFDGTNLRVLTIGVAEEEETVTLVPEKASAGYTKGYGDTEFIGNLPQMHLPFPEINKNKTYRIFQIQGDSMTPIASGSYLITHYLLDWSDIKEGRTYVLLTKEDGVVFKRILQQKDTGFVLRSDNPDYQDYLLPTEDVLEIWEVQGYLAFDLPDPRSYSENNLKVLKAIDDLKVEVQKLSK